MADMILLEPIDLLFGPTTTPWLDTDAYYGAGGANMVTDDPREVWRANYVNVSISFFIDLGADTVWDTLMIVNTNAAAGATWTVSDGVAATGSFYITTLVNDLPFRVPSEEIADTNGPGLYWTAAPRNTRYIFFRIFQPAGAPYLTIGRVLIGKSWSPALPREYGAGRPPIDSGSRSRLDSGGLAIVAGALVSGFKWTFGDLDPTDLAKLWGMFRRRRTTGAIALIEAPAAPVAEGAHYGTFVNLEAYERNDANKSRWSLQMEDWV